MSRATLVFDSEGRFYGVRILCPGCSLRDDSSPNWHVMQTDWILEGCERIDQPRPDLWGFNGNLDMPTFSPSILTRWDAREVDDPNAPIVWEDIPGMPGAKRDARPGHVVHHVCHSFVREGRIEFLSDCTHALAGKTVDLREIEVDAP